MHLIISVPECFPTSNAFIFATHLVGGRVLLSLSKQEGPEVEVSVCTLMRSNGVGETGTEQVNEPKYPKDVVRSVVQDAFLNHPCGGNCGVVSSLWF